MDVLYHGLTGLIISKAISGEYMTSAAVFAVLPDLLGALPYQYQKIKHSSKKSLAQFIKDFIKFTGRDTFFGRLDKLTYRVSHSLIFYGLLTLILWSISKNHWWILSLSYLSHIGIDIFTHQGEFSQRLLFPISDWHITGKSWTRHGGTYVFFWIVLGLLFLIVKKK